METTYLHVHHMSTPMGECLETDCPHCGKPIELTFRTLEDGDTVLVECGEEALDDKDDLS